MTRPRDPRGAARRGSDNPDLGYGAANDTPKRRDALNAVLGRKAPQLPMTGCHMYQAPAAPACFPGAMAVYTRCPRHRPAASIDLGPVAGHCIQCDMEPFTVTHEQPEY